MKRITSVMSVVFMVSIALLAQAATTRPVNVTWGASSSTTVTGYNVLRCAVPTGAATCTPSGTALNGSTLIPATTLAYTDPAVPTGSSYVYGVVAVAPACSGTSSPTVPCGDAPMSDSGLVPVPPTPAGAGSIIVIVP